MLLFDFNLHLTYRDGAVYLKCDLESFLNLTCTAIITIFLSKLLGVTDEKFYIESKSACCLKKKSAMSRCVG